jgi:glycyl-tRNA synthetase beta chain
MSERADFLLEIGCEDLPAGDLASALTYLGKSLSERLNSTLPHEKIEFYGTARRLSLTVAAMALSTEEKSELVTGPPEAAAKDRDGNWTQTALGFARKFGIPVEELTIVEDKGTRKLACKKVIPSVPANELIPTKVTDLLDGLVKQLNRTMRWGSGDFTFPRPIRWIVALLGSQVIDFDIAGVRSGNTSYGHHFLAPEPFTVTSVDQYLQELSQRYVVLDGEERRKRIREHGDKLAAERHARIVWDEQLLGVVADQVEYPQTLIGEFPADYAELPRALISATLTGYQKYFPLEDASGKLLPYFLAIYDSSPEAEANVRHGNQSALSSRLADAKFFYEHDLNTGLAAMREHLAGRGYLPGMGTVLDKSERLIHITEYLADEVEKGNPGIIVDREALKQAAEYCKADLESAVVGEKEFAHLQGEMGFHYALAEKLPAITALAIREHYSPRAAGDPPAATTEGRIVALADKLDHLAALASIGKLPKGGDDPFGARRAAVGMIINLLGISESEIVKKKKAYDLNIWLRGMFIESFKTLKRNPQDIDAAEKFVRSRFINLIDDYQIIRKDYLLGIESVHGDFISSCYHRILLIDEAIRDLPEWQPLAESAKRCRNILDAAVRDGIVIKPAGYDKKLIKLEEETSLIEAFENVHNEFNLDIPNRSIIGSELEHFIILSKLRTPLHKFFEKVFVMDTDIDVRDNRLAILRMVYDLLRTVMDFSKIEIVTKKDI